MDQLLGRGARLGEGAARRPSHPRGPATVARASEGRQGNGFVKRESRRASRSPALLAQRNRLRSSFARMSHFANPDCRVNRDRRGGQGVRTPGREGQVRPRGEDRDRGVSATASAQLDDTTPLTTSGSTSEYLTSSAPSPAPTNMLSTDG